MRQFIPTAFTIGNLFCGFLALYYAFNGSYETAAWLIFLGAVFDKMDGQLARVMGRDSMFGLQFDSIVDACTFGVVPAAIIYQAHLQSHLPTGWGLALAFVFLLCGAMRLARFNTLNLDGERDEFYLGLAIPTAAVCLTQYVVFVKAWPIPHATPLAVLLILVLSFLMVSRLNYDSVPNFRGASLSDRFKQLYFIATVGLLIYDDIFFLPMILVYVFSGPLRWIFRLMHGSVTQHA